MHPRAVILLLLTGSLTWLFVVSMLAHRFNVPSSDGILYSLPFGTARHPLDLGIPFLDDFDGYGSSWGHHWPGTMWLRGAIFTILPYSRLADVVVLSCFQWLAAFTAAFLVWRATGSIYSSLPVLVILLSDRLLLLACAGNRIEAPAVAAVLLLTASTLQQGGIAKRGWMWLGGMAAFFCASGHPYSLALGGLILGLDLHAVRRDPHLELRSWWFRAGGFSLGCAAMAAWFMFDPAAWHQFRVNMDLQKSFYNNWATVWAGLGNYRLHAGILLWGAGTAIALVSFIRLPRNQDQTNGLCDEPLVRHSATLLIAVLILHTITRCENFHYLAFGSPFAAIVVFVFFTRIRDVLPARFSWLPVPAAAILTLSHVILLPHRLVQFTKAGRPNLHVAYQSILESTPQGSTLYISHTLWPVAVEDTSHTIRWFTFPIASKWTTRRRYEELAYANAKRGDILILDQGDPAQVDRFGLFPTFEIHPPDPAKWKHLRDHHMMFPGTIPWGINLSLFEYQGRD